MSCDIDGYNEVERTTYPRARKEHRCDACRETIRVGDRYARTFIVWEGEPETWFHCARCNALFKGISGRHRELRTGEGVQFDLDCGHSWQEIFDEEPPPEIARLAFLTPDEAQKELATR
jgi:hypothetical protein